MKIDTETRLQKRIHNLKIAPQYFKDVISDKKKFEVRFNDRNFKVGDIVVLEEFDKFGYTGKFVNTEIIYILDDINYCKKDYIVFGFKLRLDRGAVL